MEAWTVISVILAAAGYLLLQSAMGRPRKQVAVGAGLISIGLVLASTAVEASAENLLFLAFSALATAGGVAFLVHRQPVRAALGFAASVLALCGLYFLLDAPFLAAATVIIYAGATIIIFLFVLMFSQRSVVEAYDLRLANPIAATVAASLLLLLLTHSISDAADAAVEKTNGAPTSGGAVLTAAPLGDRPFSGVMVGREASQVRGLGRSLYSDYLWGVELAGTLLLVAAVGAIAIAQKSTEAQP